jgi:hypothetical protein
MSNLRSALDKYPSMRKGLGYKYEYQTCRLIDFVAFIGEAQGQGNHDEAGHYIVSNRHRSRPEKFKR